MIRSELRRDELQLVEGLPVTGASRTLIDLAAVCDQGQLERSLSEIGGLRITDGIPPAALLERYPGKPGGARLRGALIQRERWHNRTRSDPEQEFLDFCDAWKITRPQTNFNMPANGFDVGFTPLEVDAIWIDEQLIVELDTLGTHGDPESFERDRARDRALSAHGRRVFG